MGDQPMTGPLASRLCVPSAVVVRALDSASRRVAD